MHRFATRYHIDLSEAEYPLSDYQSIQELFTRKLKSGLRPVAAQPMVHPVDGELTNLTQIKNGQLLQVKGWNYSLHQLLQEDDVSAFEGGTQLTYYLCPTDYHRVHSPVEGQIIKVRYIPGQLWPVNGWSVLNIPRLFARNERVIIWIRTAYGDVALVMVGATNVGQMTLSFDSQLISNVGQPAIVKMYDPAISVEPGREVGIFNMGSTVVMVYPARFPVSVAGAVPRQVRLGEA